jgi:hypothetical protein
LTSITDNDDSAVDGRLLAMNGAVSLDDTTVNILPAELASSGVPDTGGTFSLLGSVLAFLLVFRGQLSLPPARLE